MLTHLLAYLDEEEDQRLLEDIFYTYSKQMYVLAESYLHRPADAEDVVGTVFERIASKNFDIVRAITDETDLRNYLLKATKNTALNAIGKKRQDNAISDREENFISFEDLVSEEDLLEQICTKLEYEDVLLAIARMDEKYRNVLYYHFVLEKSIPETAKLLFQSVSATKQQLVRGKKQLLTVLSEKGGAENVCDKSRA